MIPLGTSLLQCFLLLSIPITSVVAASDSSGKDNLLPCVARSASTGFYYDLNAISLSPPSSASDSDKSRKRIRDESWHAKGHDYNANFTLNFCAPVVEDVVDVVGVDRQRWGNVSAYYEKDNKIYSIGQQASEPFFRGRKLVLNYTDGSPCPGEFLGNASRTKSTIMSFLCDNDSPGTHATPSFVGTMDQCTYFFEVRTAAACGGVAPSDGDGLGPAEVFGVIALIAVAAYFLGGCAYQRTVMHQRGWRQCPNYSLWAGMFDFLKDMMIILFTSLANLLRCNRTRSSAGYARANSTGGFMGAIGGRGRGRRTGRSSDVDAENRLIDQLDEEWED